MRLHAFFASLELEMNTMPQCKAIDPDSLERVNEATCPAGMLRVIEILISIRLAFLGASAGRDLGRRRGTETDTTHTCTHEGNILPFYALP